VPKAFNNMGVIFRELENSDRAMAAYETALRLRPLFPEALNNVGMMYSLAGKVRAPDLVS
jgi:Flp pilus assembly protein TadD